MDNENDPIHQEFLSSLSFLSKKLTKFQYELVCHVMFNLYMGKTYGFDPAFDERFLPLCKMYWYSKGKNDFNTKNIPENEGKAIIFKVYDGGKKKK
jgi:hypothetical protein